MAAASVCVLVLFQIAVTFVLVQTQQCSDYTLCRECITSPSCIWCSDPDFEGSHCINREYSSNCTLSDIQDPRSSLDNIQNAPGQISPVSTQLSLRVGEPQSFNVRVSPSSNYPLDLYILMDLSRSMQNDLENVKRLTNELASTLGNITMDYRVGFGAFNEKPIQPFVYEELNPALTPTDFSFRHFVSLTNNITKLSDTIAPLDTVVNHDNPESMLEALLQVVVCRETVGWRNESRKLVLVLTDQLFHIAGDGKLLGLLKRSDGKCYVPVQNSSGLPVDYEMYDVFDYPSIGHVRAVLQEFDVIPIFSSVPTFQEEYQALANLIEGSVFQVLQSQSANFLELIENSYNATSQRVELLPLTDSDIQFNISTDCGGTLQSMTGISACDEVQIGQTVDFSVQVTLQECTQNLPRNVSLRIPGFGIVNVQISGICSCSCESETVFNSTDSCSGNGHLSCGVCECLPGWFGDMCQCDSEEAVSRPCLPGISRPDGGFCSDRGECVCGECQCNQPVPELLPVNFAENAVYFGDGCECDNFTCPQNETGYVCSDRGVCGCNQRCDCEVSPFSGLSYTGIACQCPPVEEACLNPTVNDRMICSEHGVCDCDQCRCEAGFTGTYCNTTVEDIMVSCNGRVCVECAKKISASEVDCESLNSTCAVVLIEPVEDMDYEIDGTLALECSFVDASDCRHVYFTIGRAGAIHAENVESCSAGLPIPIWAIALITLGGLILLGVVLLVTIKVILKVLDWYEVHQWEKTRGDVHFGKTDNPLYLSCEQNYKNVAYYSPEEEREKEMRERSRTGSKSGSRRQQQTKH